MRGIHLIDFNGMLLGTIDNPMVHQTQIFGHMLNDRQYQADTFEQTLAAGGHFKYTIENPANSGKLYIVFATMFLHTAAAMSFIQWRHNPTTSLPATTVTPVNSKITNPINNENSQAIVMRGQSETTAMGGGTLIGTIAMPPDVYGNIIQVPWALAAGVKVGFNMPVTGTGVRSTIQLGWYEIDA